MALRIKIYFKLVNLDNFSKNEIIYYKIVPAFIEWLQYHRKCERFLRKVQMHTIYVIPCDWFLGNFQ